MRRFGIEPGLGHEALVEENGAGGGGDGQAPVLAIVDGALLEQRRHEVGLLVGVDQIRAKRPDGAGVDPFRHPDGRGVDEVGHGAGRDALRREVVDGVPADDFERDVDIGIGGLEIGHDVLPEGQRLGAVFGGKERQFLFHNGRRNVGRRRHNDSRSR